jgi:Spy/CpxP family protein refolding chaperone
MNAALKWKLIAGFLLVFVAGAVTGGFIAATTTRHYLFSAHHGMGAQRMRDRLRSQLDLTPEQVTKISPVLDKAAAQLEEIRKDTAHRVRETFANAHKQIADDLTPEQRAKLAQLRDGHRRHLHRFHQREETRVPASPPP